MRNDPRVRGFGLVLLLTLAGGLLALATTPGLMSTTVERALAPTSMHPSAFPPAVLRRGGARAWVATERERNDRASPDPPEDAAAPSPADAPRGDGAPIAMRRRDAPVRAGAERPRPRAPPSSAAPPPF